jgi:hypothetical protein
MCGLPTERKRQPFLLLKALSKAITSEKLEVELLSKASIRLRKWPNELFLGKQKSCLLLIVKIQPRILNVEKLWK